MGIHDEFAFKFVHHPEWEVIRNEVEHEVFSELCWWLNNGPGYCESAPQYIKDLINRFKF